MLATAHKNRKRAAFAIFLLAAIGGQAIFPLGTPRVLAQAGVPVVESNPVVIGAETQTAASSATILTENLIQTFHSTADNLKEFVGDYLATALGKAVLRAITQSVVNWINSGFEGSPSFVTNPEGFLVDVADQTIGAAIEFAAPLLCSPFRFDIRAALGLNFSFGAKHRLGCRLTDVITNLEGSYDTFVAGDFTAGGWNNWINITGVPQNNPYGAYLETVDAVDARIISATGQEVKLLDFGRGFMSWRSCEVPGDLVPATDRTGNVIYKDGGEPLTKKGPCKKKGPIKTPGSVIEGQLQSSLGVDLQALGFADEINEIFAALLNQLIKQVFTSGGLASSRNYSAQEYDRYDPSTARSESTYQSIGLNVSPGSIRQFAQNEEARDDARNEVKNRAEDERDRVQGDVDRRIADGANLLLATSTSAASFEIRITDQNLAGSENGMPKTVRQSSMPLPASRGPEMGNDGNKNGNPNQGSVIETAGGTNEWWEVDLGQVYTLDTVRIYPRRSESDDPKTSLPFSTYLGNTYIFVTEKAYDASSPNRENGTLIPLPGGGVTDTGHIGVKLSKNNVGQFLRIQRVGNGALSFAEVEANQVQDSPATKSIPQFTNLTAELYRKNRDAVNVKKGIVGKSSEELAHWQGTFPNLGAIKGIDGNTNGNRGAESGYSLVGVVNPQWNSDRCNSAYGYSGCDNVGVRYPWWEVDLGARMDIGEIKLWRRTDLSYKDGDGLSDSTYLFITDDPYDPTAEDALAWIPSAAYTEPLERHLQSQEEIEAEEPEKRPITISLSPNKKGRYIRLQKATAATTTEHSAYSLWFSELQAFNKQSATGLAALSQANIRWRLSHPTGSDAIALSPEATRASYSNPKNTDTTIRKATEFTVTNSGAHTETVGFETYVSVGDEKRKAKFGAYFYTLSVRFVATQNDPERLLNDFDARCELIDKFGTGNPVETCDSDMNATLTQTALPIPPGQSITVRLVADARISSKNTSLFADRSEGSLVTEIKLGNQTIKTHSWNFFGQSFSEGELGN